MPDHEQGVSYEPDSRLKQNEKVVQVEVRLGTLSRSVLVREFRWYLQTWPYPANIISQYKQNRLIENFVSGSTARTAVSLCCMNRKAAAFFFLRLLFPAFARNHCL